ncbi:MAG: hypothetical protein ACLRTT_16300 [Lachnospiraceae bacterium]
MILQVAKRIANIRFDQKRHRPSGWMRRCLFYAVIGSSLQSAKAACRS